MSAPGSDERSEPPRFEWLWVRSGPSDEQLRRGALDVGNILMEVGRAVAEERLEALDDAHAMVAAGEEMHRHATRFVRDGRHDPRVRDELRRAILAASHAVIAVARGPEQVPGSARELGPVLSEIWHELADDGEPTP